MTAKPRVLILQVAAENAGTQEIARLLDQGLSARGFEVFELYFFTRKRSAFRDAPNVIVCAAGEQRIAGRLRMIFRVLKEVRRLKPDIILCLQWDGNLFGGLLGVFARRAKIIAQQFSAPLMMPAWARFLDKLQGAAGLFSRIIVNSADIEQRYSRYPARYRRALVKIDHGFMEKGSSMSRTQARAAFGLPEDAVMLASVGRLTHQKHFDASIRLLPLRPRWHLALCGQGILAEQLRALARELGCEDRLHLIGELHPDRVGDFLAAADVFVFPAISESFGLAPVEAAQAGIPVVANDIAILREVLSVDGEPCALFADADDAAATAAAISRVLEDERLRSVLTSRGRRLKERFSLDRMYDEYAQLLRSISAPG